MLNPALMTFREYYQVANKEGKFHSSNAYGTTVERLNSYSGKRSDYPRLLNRSRINGFDFEFRSKPDNTVAVFNSNVCVGTVSDEWGCILIQVAEEFNGFGLGTQLGKIIRTLLPEKTSGGFTPQGYSNFVRVYREFVRDALTNGTYRTLIREKKLQLNVLEKSFKVPNCL